MSTTTFTQEQKAAMDEAMASEFPIVIAGEYTFKPLAGPGSRFVLTANGLMLEACNGVYHSFMKTTPKPSLVRFPFQQIEPSLTVVDRDAHDAITQAISQFTREKAADLSREHMLLIVADADGKLRFDNPSIDSGPGHVTYQERLTDGQHLVCDIHSHAGFPAFFSYQDDTSDSLFSGHLKLSYVMTQAPDFGPKCLGRAVTRGLVGSTFDAAKRTWEIQDGIS